MLNTLPHLATGGIFSAALIAGTAVHAANIPLYTADGTFFSSAPAGFTFGAFAGNVTESATSLTIDATGFGGLGRDLAVVDFDPANYQIHLIYRLLAGNEAADFRIILRDTDGDDSAPGTGREDYQFFVDTTFATPLGNGFSEQFVPLNAVFRQQSFNSTNDGDGVLNPGLDQWQLQSAFGSNARLNLELASVELREIPEPASAALIAALGILASRRRRA